MLCLKYNYPYAKIVIGLAQPSLKKVTVRKTNQNIFLETKEMLWATETFQRKWKC